MGVVKAPGTVAVFCKGGKRPHLHRKETAHPIRVCGYKPFQFFWRSCGAEHRKRKCNGPYNEAHTSKRGESKRASQRNHSTHLKESIIISSQVKSKL
jgi:hypothetical protein